jgi:putative ABC transport system permease protein
VIILALGIGSSTAVFSVLYQVLLKPLPYPDGQRLVFVHNFFPKNQVPVEGVSGFDYSEIRRHTDIFSAAGVFFWNDLVLTDVGEARHADVVNASASLFEVLGVKPELGARSPKQKINTALQTPRFYATVRDAPLSAAIRMFWAA